MKFMTVKTYPYTAKLFDFTIEVDGAGNSTRTYTFKKFINFKGGIGTGSSLQVYTEEPLLEFQHLRDLVDADGEDIFQTTVWYEIRTTQPTLNPYGTVEGYRANAVKLG